MMWLREGSLCSAACNDKPVAGGAGQLEGRQLRERAQARVIGSRAEEGQLARSMLSVFRGCAQAGKGWVQGLRRPELAASSLAG